MRPTKQRLFSPGFTLVELMVTVTILAVLAVVAVTSYRVYIQRARSQEAKEMLLAVKMKQEQYFASYSQYIDSAANDDEDQLYPPDGDNGLIDGGGTDPTTWDWTLQACAGAASGSDIEAFCHLGYRPSSPTYFRLITVGWQPGDGIPASNHQLVLNMDFSRRWFYAVAHGDLDNDGTLSTFIMTSQLRDIVMDQETE